MHSNRTDHRSPKIALSSFDPWHRSLSIGVAISALGLGMYGIGQAARALENHLDRTHDLVPAAHVIGDAALQLDAGASVVRSVTIQSPAGPRTVELSSIRINGMVRGEGEVKDGAFSNILKCGEWSFSADGSFNESIPVTVFVRGGELRRISQTSNRQSGQAQSIEIIPLSIARSSSGLTIFTMDVLPARAP